MNSFIRGVLLGFLFAMIFNSSMIIIELKHINNNLNNIISNLLKDK